MKTLSNLLLGFLLLGSMACNQVHSDSEPRLTKSFAPLKQRNEVLSRSGDWILTQNRVSYLFQTIQSDSNDLKSKLLLVQIYMQEARITGDHPYYYPAALQILEDVLRHEPKNFEALAFKASVLLSLHHFKEALSVGKTAQKINGNNGFIYGVLVDANVELGNYEEAVRMSDRMQSVRPGLESYSRASYLREIYGDNNGAIEAMKLAYEAGMPGSEEACWAGNTLAHLYENTGNLQAAKAMALVLLQQRPSYAFATDARGRIELAQKNYGAALLLFDSALSAMPEVSFMEHKAEALRLKGDPKQAKAVYAKVLAMLKEDAASGHYTEMEMAMTYIELGDPAMALKYAQTEYKRRPMNIDVNHTMAWVLYKAGRVNEAKTYMDVALRMGTQNARMLQHAGMIETALGNQKAAVKYQTRALQINPLLRGNGRDNS